MFPEQLLFKFAGSSHCTTMASSSSTDAAPSSFDETLLRSILGEVGMDEEWLTKLVEDGVAAPDAVEILSDSLGLICNRGKHFQSEGSAELLVCGTNI